MGNPQAINEPESIPKKGTFSHNVWLQAPFSPGVIIFPPLLDATRCIIIHAPSHIKVSTKVSKKFSWGLHIKVTKRPSGNYILSHLSKPRRKKKVQNLTYLLCSPRIVSYYVAVVRSLRHNSLMTE